MSATIAAIKGPNSGLAQPIVPGSTYALEFTLTGDSSYPTGGYPFAIAQVQAAIQQGMAIQYVIVESPVALISDSVGTPATTGYLAAYDALNGKVQLFWPGATAADEPFAEVTSTTNVSAAVVRLLVFFR